MTQEWKNAVRRGSVDELQRLLGAGALVDARDEHGQSALMLAVVNGHVAVVRTLVRAGANLDLRGTGAPGFAGKTALDLALARGEPDIVKSLTAAG